MAKKIKRSKSKSAITTEAMLTILRQVHLGGVIDECALYITAGKGSIEAVDITNSLIVIADKAVATKDIDDVILGLGNLDLLISFFSSVEDSKMTMKYKPDDDFCTFKRKDGRRKLDYLLTQPDLIATNLSLEEEEEEEEEAYDRMLELMQYNVELTPSLIKDLLRYMGMLASKEATIIFDGEQEVKFRLGGSEDHQFELVLSEEVNYEGEDEPEEVELVVNGEHLAKVFGVVNYDEDDPPMLKFASDEVPIMIEYEGICWCLNPLAEFEEE